MDSCINVVDLVKSFGTFAAVSGINFEVKNGECLGLLGPNGAGKTTTIRMMTCFTPITRGKIFVQGLDVSAEPRKVKNLLGICSQDDNLDPDFTVQKNLEVYARYFGIPKNVMKTRVQELLDFVELSDRAQSKIQQLSGGLKRRLVLARALVNQPKILVLDEPTTGLDPSARQIIWQKIRKLKSDGVSVLLTSHYMEEVAQLCDRVVLMDRGKIVLEGHPHAIVQNEVGKEVVELWDTTPEIETWISSQNLTFEKLGERIFISDKIGGQVSSLIQAQYPHLPKLVRPASLEDVFLRKTGQKLDG